MSWSKAEEHCGQLDGHLASVTSLEENDWLGLELSSQVSGSLWLGGQWSPGSNWTWSDSSEWVWTNWASGQPSQQYNPECALLHTTTGYSWGSYDCSTDLKFVCKYV